MRLNDIRSQRLLYAEMGEYATPGLPLMKRPSALPLKPGAGAWMKIGSPHPAQPEQGGR
ncbi:hypothetical protein ACTG15_15315 [Aeromonas sp. 164P]